MKPFGDFVQVGVAMSGKVHTGGVRRCANVWACPVCAPVIRARRAQEIDQALVAWKERGGKVMFVTATIPHRRSDTLAESMDQLTDFWRRLWMKKPVTTGRACHRVAGQIRAIEVTHGRNGWHPHIHAAVLLEGSLTDFGLTLAAGWADLFRRTGLNYVPGVSFDFREADDDTGTVSAYMSGVDSWSLGSELAQSTAKGSTPFGLLRASAAGHSWARDLWSEWERTTRGRRAIQWTPGLRAFLGLVDEVSDDEAAVAEVTEPLRFTYWVPARNWEYHRKRGILPVLLLSLANGDPPAYVRLSEPAAAAA